MSPKSPLSPTLVAALAGLGLAGRAVLRGVRRADLRGQVAVVTGGSRGLGLALARQLADRGCKLALCARDADELERVRAELSERGVEVMVGTCDVTRRDEVERFIAGVERHYGQIDVLIANAATIRVGPFTAMKTSDFEQAMNDIFWGAVHATMAVLPGMRRRRAGRIVHISSIGGKVPVPHLAPYTAAKFALSGFSENAHAELRKEGITVTTVAPGLMRTGSHLNAEFKGQADKEFSWFSLSLLTRLGSISAERAAASIVDAIEQGETHVVLSLPAKLLALAHGVAPGLFTRAMALVDRLGLPADDGRDQPAVRGMEVRDEAIGSSFIHAAGDGDAEKYHQFPGPFGGRQPRGSA